MESGATEAAPEYGDAPGVALAQFSGSLVVLTSADPVALSDGRLKGALREVFTGIQRAEAVYLGLLGELGKRPDAVPGAKAGAGGSLFVREILRRSSADAGRDVRAAAALDPARSGAEGGLPRMRAALAAGEVSRDHVDVAVRAIRDVPAKLRRAVDGDGVANGERIDETLWDLSRRFAPKETARLASHLVDVLDPQGRDRFDTEAHLRRRWDAVVDSTGMSITRGALDPANAARYHRALEYFSAPGYGRSAEAEGDGEGDSAGQGGVPVRDDRTGSMRRADAIGIMSDLAMEAAGRDASGAPSSSGVPRMVVFTTPEQLAEAMTRPEHTGDPRRDDEDSGDDRNGGVRASSEHGDGDSGGGEHRVGDSGGGEHGVGDSGGGEHGVGDSGGGEHRVGDSGGGEHRVGESGEYGNSSGYGNRGGGARNAKGVGGVRPGGRGTGARWVAPGFADGEHVGAIPSSFLAQLACDAILQRVLLAPDGKVLDLGRDVRTATPAQKRALAARDGGCIIAGCGVPASRCHAHHIQYWSEGGLTDVAVMALLCPRHHREVHLGIWRIIYRNGLPHGVPPTWIDPAQKPVRNTRLEEQRRLRALGQQLTLNLRGRSADGHRDRTCSDRATERRPSTPPPEHPEDDP